MKNKEFIGRLKHAEEDIELRVRERTEDLTIKNEKLKLELRQSRQSEKLLRDSEERYRALAENVADGVGVIQNRKLVYGNDTFAKMFDYSIDSIIKKNLFELFRDDYSEQFKQAFGFTNNNYKEEFKKTIKQLENGILIKYFHVPCVSGKGRELWVEGHHNFIKWNGKHAVLITVRDITSNKFKEIAVKEKRELYKKENRKLRSVIKKQCIFANIVGESDAMQEVYEFILRASASDASVVISGESGTGKELIARNIHSLSRFKSNPFVPVNCGAIPEHLFESEFFGYKKGAFTGAYMDKHGYFDAANEGSLFLDEVGELSLSMQVKLLRAIEGNGYIPVGGNESTNANVRILAATNRDLTNQVKNGMMREDFYYRIHVITITVPPLKERKEDIPLLVDHFLEKYSNCEKQHDIPGKVLETLYNYDWPGNVRELQNVLLRYLAVNHLGIENNERSIKDDLELSINNKVEENKNFRMAVRDYEKKLIINALHENQWHKANAAMMLGIPRRTFFRKLQNIGL